MGCTGERVREDGVYQGDGVWGDGVYQGGGTGRQGALERQGVLGRWGALGRGCGETGCSREGMQEDGVQEVGCTRKGGAGGQEEARKAAKAPPWPWGCSVGEAEGFGVLGQTGIPPPWQFP